MKKGKGKKRKKGERAQPRIWSASWGTFAAFIAVFSGILWFVLVPFLNPQALVVTKLLIVVVPAIVCSALATYALNSALVAVSRRRRRRT